MISEKVIIKNESGIHLHPAGMLVGEANKFRCHVMMHYGERKMNCKSLMSLLAFPVCPGEEVTIECEGEGEDEEEACRHIVNFLNNMKDQK